MNKKAACLLSVVVVMILIIVAFNYKWIYYHLYPFDRITGTYSITVNGESINSIEQYYESEPSKKIRLENDTKSFKIKGGYGMHKIGFIVDNDVLYKTTNDERFKECDDINLDFSYFNTNGWHVIEFDIKIDIVDEAGTWYACYDVNWICPTEDFEKVEHSLSKKVELGEAVGIRLAPPGAKQ